MQHYKPYFKTILLKVTESLVIVRRKIYQKSCGKCSERTTMSQGDNLQHFPGAAFGGKYKHIQTLKSNFAIKKLLIILSCH